MKIAVDIETMSFDQLVYCWFNNPTPQETISLAAEIKYCLKDRMSFSRQEEQAWLKKLKCSEN